MGDGSFLPFLFCAGSVSAGNEAHLSVITRAPDFTSVLDYPVIGELFTTG